MNCAGISDHAANAIEGKLREADYAQTRKHRFYGAPGAIPTRDLPLRRRTLYAAELREHELVNRKW